MESMLVCGDIVFLIGIMFIALVIGAKMISFIIKKEFALFKLLFKIGLCIALGGGSLLFIGRLLA